jgi:hypothetical protein
MSDFASAWPDHLRPPTTRICAEAYDMCARVAANFLLNHSIRVFAWGCLLAPRDGVPFDRELLYVASLLHDLGLTDAFAGHRCFELESADAARRFARKRGWDDDRCWILAEAIRLHMQPRVFREDGAEAYLLDAGTTLDCSGTRYEDVPEGDVALVLRAAPRESFKDAFLVLLGAHASAKPGCMAELALQTGLAERMIAAPFES